MNANNFFRGLSWLILLNLLIKPVWIFGIDRWVQNTIGHETYGVYFSLLNLSIILGIVADAGLTNMYNRQLALREPPDFRKLLITKLFLSGIFLSVFFMVCIFTRVQINETVILIGSLQVLTSFLVFFRSILTGNQLFRRDAVISVTDKILMILVCGLFLLPHTGDMTLNTFLYIQCAATGAAILLAYTATSGIKSHSGHHVDIRSVIRLTYPFILLILLMGLHTRLDGFLLERLHYNGAFEAGVYASAYRLLDAGNMVGYLAASFIVPFVSRHLADQQLISETVLKIRHGLMLLAIPAVIFVAGFSREIIELLYHKDSSYYGTVLVLCIAVLPAYYLIHLYGSLLTAKGLFKTFSILLLFTVVVNVILNMLLIRKYGAEGCCLAALISQYLLAALCCIQSGRSYKLSAGWRSVVVYILAALVFAGIVYFVRYLGILAG